MPDEELQAMSTIVESLSPLTDDQRARVLRWAGERFGADGALPIGSQRGLGAEAAHEGPLHDVAQFKHFAELYAAAQPTTDAEKALVAGYWLQVVQDQDKWKAFDAQKALKDMGHALSHISQALQANIDLRPQRVIQLQKAGNSQQGRKTYKLTHEGIKFIQERINGGA